MPVARDRGSWRLSEIAVSARRRERRTVKLIELGESFAMV